MTAPGTTRAVAWAGEAPPTYTRQVRRWVVVAWMLVGFLGQGYVYATRASWPTRIERSLDESTGLRAAWWLERWA